MNSAVAHQKSVLQHFLKLWILFSAFCVAAGWILSAANQLNRMGYLAISIALAIYFVSAKKYSSSGKLDFKLRFRRFRRPLPAIYLLFVVLSFIGGLIYAPTNYDALTYRFPRVLHWWAAEQWHWFFTSDYRMNSTATGMEWVMTPLFTFAQSDRPFFLINIASYLLLPGLVFAVFRRLGVSVRVAWNWMWLLPTAYCYVMQAGGIGNDAFATVYFLASIYYSLRARESGEVKFLWLAMLSAALLTGAKLSNAPLALPCIVAALPAMRLMNSQKLATLCVFLFAVLISFLPNAVLNYRFSGSWDGDAENISLMKVTNPAAALAGNTILLANQSLMPPVLPKARELKSWMEAQIPESLRELLRRDFPRFDIGLGELPQEEGSGLGLSITALIILSACSPILFRGRRRHSGTLFRKLSGAILAATWISFLVFMVKLGSEATARLLTPYYPLLLMTALVHPANVLLVKKRWWKILAVLCAISPLPGMLLTPSRPLVPVERPIAFAENRIGPRDQLTRAKNVYALYRQKNDVLGPLRKYLPTDARAIGLIAGMDDSEVALWRPFGERRVVHIDSEEISATEAASIPKWIVVNSSAIGEQEFSKLKQAIQDRDGKIVGETEIISKLARGPQRWVVLQLP